MRVTISIQNWTTDIEVSEERDEVLGMKRESRPIIIEAANRALAALGEQKIADEADIWDAGFDGHRYEVDRQAADPSYPIHRPNPYRKEK